MPDRVDIGSNALKGAMRHLFQTREGPGRGGDDVDDALLKLFVGLWQSDQDVAALLTPVTEHLSLLSPSGTSSRSATLHKLVSDSTEGSIVPVLLSAHNTLLCFTRPSVSDSASIPADHVLLQCFDLAIPTKPGRGHSSYRVGVDGSDANTVTATLQGPRQVLSVPSRILSPVFWQQVVRLRDTIESTDVSYKKGTAVREERAMPDGHVVYEWLLASLEGSGATQIEWPVFSHPVSPIAVYDSGTICRKSMVLYTVETLCRLCIQRAGVKADLIEDTLDHIMLRLRSRAIDTALDTLSATTLVRYGVEWERQTLYECEELPESTLLGHKVTLTSANNTCKRLRDSMEAAWARHTASLSQATLPIKEAVSSDFRSSIGHHMPKVDAYISSADRHPSAETSTGTPTPPSCPRRCWNALPTCSDIQVVLVALHDVYEACLDGGYFPQTLTNLSSASECDAYLQRCSAVSTWLSKLDLRTLASRHIHLQSRVFLLHYAVAVYTHKAACKRDRLHGSNTVSKGRLSVDTTALHSLLFGSEEELRLVHRVERYFEKCRSSATGCVIGKGSGDVPSQYASHSADMCKYIRQLEDSYKAACKAKKREVRAQKEEYERLEEISLQKCECVFDDNHFRTRFCTACRATSTMKSMYVKVVEDPLPKSETEKRVVAFFALMPTFLQHMYAVLTRLEKQLATSAGGPVSTTYEWPVSCVNSLVPTLRSTTMKFKDSHYSIRHVSAKYSEFYVPNGRNINILLESRGYSCYTAARVKYVRYPHQSVWSADRLLGIQVETPYSCLQTASLDAVWGVSHTQNQVLARQCDRATGLDPAEFVAYGSLRAGGHLQVRNVLSALASSTLSFNESGVADLVGLALRQAGPPREHPCDVKYLREWHGDWLDFDVVDSMVEHTTRLLDSVSENWCHEIVMETVLSVAKVMRACGQREKGNSLLTLCFDCCVRWLDMMRETEAALDTEGAATAEVDKVRSKMTRVLCYAISALEDVPLTRERALVFMSLLACLRDSVILRPGTDTAAHVVDAFRVSLSLQESLVSLLTGDGSILPEFVGSHWNAAEGRTPTFTQHTGDACRYWWARYDGVCVQFDTFYGNFLVDGYPSTRLPDSITSGALYARTFGNKIFRVHRATSHSYVTTSAYRGLVFFFGINGSIHMTERGNRWLLVPHSLLAPHMARFLTTKYSHWLCLKAEGRCQHSGCILFRPVRVLSETVRQRDVPRDFHMEPPSSTHPYLATPGWRLIKNDGRHVVCRTSRAVSRLMRVFKCLDSLEHVVVYCTADNGLTPPPEVCLVRLGLHFSIEPRCIRSLEFPSLHVDTRTNPLGVLVGLQAKLVLSDVHGVPQRYLVPHGSVDLTRKSGCVHHTCTVSLSGRCSNPPVFCFGVSHTLRCLDVQADTYWPYLALLHAATASPMREPFTLCKGTEMAMLYLRRCWSNAPYPAETVAAFNQIRGLTPVRGMYPPHSGLFETVNFPTALAPVCAHDGLAGLCQSLSRKAGEMGFLYEGVSSLGHVQSEMRFCPYLREAHLLPPSLLLTEEERGLIGLKDATCHHPSAPQSSTAAERRVRMGATHYYNGTVPKMDMHALLTSDAYECPFPCLEREMTRVLGCRSSYVKENRCPRLAYAMLMTSMYTDQSPEALFYATSFINYWKPNLMPLVPFCASLVEAKTKYLSRARSALPKWSGRHHAWMRFRPIINPYDVQAQYGEVKLNQSLEARAERCGKQWESDFESGRPLGNCFVHGTGTLETKWYKLLEGLMPPILTSLQMRQFAKTIVTCIRAPTAKSAFTIPPSNAAPTSYDGVPDLESLECTVPIPHSLPPDTKSSTLSFTSGKWPKVDALFDSCLVSAEVTSETTLTGTPFPFETGTAGPENVLSLPMGQEMLGALRESWDRSDTHLYNAGYVLADHATVVAALDKACAVAASGVESAWKRLRRCYPSRLTGSMASVSPLLLVPLVLRAQTPTAMKTALCHYLNTAVYQAKTCRCRDMYRNIAANTGLSADPTYSAHLSGKLVTDILTRHGGWSPKEYPEYLVFEAERGIMIRQHQADIAEEMRDSEGGNAVLQLKNGEGKTSVVIPLLCATISGQDPKHSTIPRVTVLASLYDTNLANLRLWMGGLLGKRVLTFPVNRGISFSATAADKMLTQLEDARKRGDTVLTVPGHRLSFLLKTREQHIKGHAVTAKALTKVVEWHQDHSFDLLDECDNLLSHKFQLVYACGLQMPLDGDSIRWEMAQAVLAAVQEIGPGLVSSQGGTSYVADTSRVSGRWCGFRITDRSQETAGAVRSAVCTHLFDTMPVFRQFSGSDRALLQAIVLGDPDVDVDALQLEPLIVVRDLTLTLRGLLHHEVLCSTLQKRWSVEYGVDTITHRRLMAVPFRAKDTPSTRSDFAHVDVAILMTHTSYYSTGLTDTQFHKTLERLCEHCNPQDKWLAWVAGIGEDAKTDGLEAVLADVSNINLADIAQTSRLYRLFGHNMVTINYYLSHFVLPLETKQFPQRLTASAWDLVNSEQCTHPVRGFSGTNDNGPTLPLGVSQRPLDSLVHTNGTVMRHILHEDNEHYELIPESPLDMLSLVHKTGCRCLIDCGAQMIALSNRRVAQTWLRLTGSDVEAAVYFSDGNRLMVLNKQGITAPFEASPYCTQLHRCVVYLDDHHSRGTDLKMPSWRAALTLGPRLTKAKLVQRQLGHGQSLTFFVPLEVDAELRAIAAERLRAERSSQGGDQEMVPTGRARRRVREERERERQGPVEEPRRKRRAVSTSKRSKGDEEEVPVCPPMPCDVLRWCVGNTCRMEQHNMILWAGQGLNYAHGETVSSLVRPTPHTGASSVYKHFLLDEHHSLPEMYGPRRDRLPGSQVVRDKCRVASHNCQRSVGALLESAQDSTGLPAFDTIEAGISARGDAYLCAVVSAATVLDEEQERELEQEREEEREEERPGPATPHTPSTLSKEVRAFIASGECSDGLDGCVQPVSKALGRTSVPHTEVDVWDTRLLCTRYYRKTVTDKGVLDCYIRPASHCLYHPDTENILLVSPWEANTILSKGLLEHAYTSARRSGQAVMLQSAARLSAKAPFYAQTSLGNRVAHCVRAQMALFAGSLYHSGRVSERVFWTGFLGVCSSSLGLVDADTVQFLVDRGLVTRVLKFICRGQSHILPASCKRAMNAADGTKFVSADAMHEYIQALLVVRGVFYAVEGSHIGEAVFPFSK
ncbi:protein of unknown function DUF3645 [Kipferlia bialata]|uniref:ubiquitinyl hydrolase 1 n=1 Tax=Kipferlia bialata TaxID=797122 RepID=A0A9K3GHK2_9EUKA|nr:protein of unknown function DUF3645 [Kipferlia bialata]|eukprot:g3787.t1